MGKAGEQIHLIVDGFNVAHAWGLVKKRSGDWINEIVRTLQEELKEIHDEKGWRVTIAMDGKGREIDRLHPFGDDSFELLYSPSSLTADAVIEQMVSGDARPELIRVGTEDRAVLHSIEAGGAEAISPAALKDEVLAARRLKRSRIKNSFGDSKNTFTNQIPL
ncbi:MAG: hypothetical protein CBC31_007010 [Verrucomicrobia bacterium TMED71]|nr:MAG: hypothetical protein CBC31_007010 [Verrucomicrobia bacterium TMED71]